MRRVALRSLLLDDEWKDTLDQAIFKWCSSHDINVHSSRGRRALDLELNDADIHI
jgi:hypothetical protein